MDKAVKKLIIKRSEEEKLALIGKWEESNLPITVFCRQHNFSDSLFHSWLNKYRRNKKQAKSTGTFIPLSIPTPPPSSEDSPFAELTLAAGHRIMFYQSITADYLRTLIS